MFNRIKNGFTLAEVLITLVIIGVVAALTIPTAINKYREQTLKSQFAKAYSTISQAIYKTEINDFYGYARCYYSVSSNSDYEITGSGVFDDCPSFFSALRKHLQIQKVCDGNAKEGGCIPEYQTYRTDVNCSGFSQYKVDNYAIVLVLSNGQIIIPYSNYSKYPLSMYLVDINGMKGPNAYGKDLFSFVIGKDSSTNSIVLDRGICEFPVSGGRTTRQMIRYALAGKQ